MPPPTYFIQTGNRGEKTSRREPLARGRSPGPAGIASKNRHATPALLGKESWYEQENGDGDLLSPPERDTKEQDEGTGMDEPGITAPEIPQIKPVNDAALASHT